MTTSKGNIQDEFEDWTDNFLERMIQLKQQSKSRPSEQTDTDPEKPSTQLPTHKDG